MAKRGVIQKAVIARIAEQRRVPIAAAAHAYDNMSIDRKNLLCIEEKRRQDIREEARLLYKEKCS